MPMNRNALFLVVAAIGVVFGIMGYQLYLSQKDTSGVEIKIDDKGVSIQKQ